MRLDDEQQSSNVEDRRGRGGFGGGRRMRVPMGRRGGGIGIGTIILLGILWLVFGINPLQMLGGGGGFEQQPQITQQQNQNAPTADDPYGKFAGKVLRTTEKTWEKIFRENGRTYEPPRMVLFSGFVQSACGNAQSAMGPFYCPLDKRIYIDLSFFKDMQRKLGAGGDFAYAYVIAHEVGHHIQNLLGIAGKVQATRLKVSKEQGNQLSVRMELQADCLAGVWAYDNKSILEQGDIEEGLNAATAIGDDRLQRRSQGYVVPESFTHGTSAQRVEWFKRGIQTGNMGACDTFG